MARRIFPSHLLLAVVLVTLALPSNAKIDRCFRQEVPEVPRPNFTKGVARFSLNLFKGVVKAQKAGENVVISPYSVWSALSLAFFGAQGRTKDQLGEVLFLTTKTSTYSHWRFIQSMLSSDWAIIKNAGKRKKRTSSGMSSSSSSSSVGSRDSSNSKSSSSTSRSSSSSSTSFLSTTKAYFNKGLTLDTCMVSSLGELETIDFTSTITAALKINADVSAATKGEIQSLVEPRALAKVQFLLLNAVFFKGSWLTQFPKERTMVRDFHSTPEVNGGPVPMMNVVGKFRYAYRSDLNASIIELPYESGFSLLVLLPAVGDQRAEAVVKKLSHRKLENAVGQMTEMEVEVTIPKFSLTTKLTQELIQVLSDMGVVDLFTQAADLRAFTQSDLHVDSAVHLASLRLTEEGTVAAAATGLLGTRIGPTKFVCDRPFVFILVDTLMRVPVFTGIYNRPPDI
ncbi:Serine protease inhibitor 88Ea-like 2 [Homarus americanus]|uniref:Serine protease inhibitor 88Ea-like 2 n=2 Tax=Homarus americanus TaxID=6706 RepID=A0A8J5JRS4_HOMAM|nr:Serine protease inhibitor 88Ea-like 2 [Homarus americanus]